MVAGEAIFAAVCYDRRDDRSGWRTQNLWMRPPPELFPGARSAPCSQSAATEAAVGRGRNGDRGRQSPSRPIASNRYQALWIPAPVAEPDPVAEPVTDSDSETDGHCRFPWTDCRWPIAEDRRSTDQAHAGNLGPRISNLGSRISAVAIGTGIGVATGHGSGSWPGDGTGKSTNLSYLHRPNPAPEPPRTLSARWPSIRRPALAGAAPPADLPRYRRSPPRSPL